MRKSQKDLIAETVIDAWTLFQVALTNKRAYPKDQFRFLFEATLDYAAATKDDLYIHKSIAGIFNGFRESLELERKRVPSSILNDADRLECIIFSGYDPYFEGDEPPGL